MIPVITDSHYDGDPAPHNYQIALLSASAFNSFGHPVIIARAIH